MAHLRQMKAVKSTAENLEAAKAGETYEYTEMYPPMVETAEAGSSPAATTFKFALAAEERHAKLYGEALEAVKAGRDIETGGIYFNTFNRFLDPLRDISRFNTGYYLLSFRSEVPGGERGYRHFRVKAKDRKVKVHARRGYRFGPRDPQD